MSNFLFTKILDDAAIRSVAVNVAHIEVIKQIDDKTCAITLDSGDIYTLNERFASVKGRMKSPYSQARHEAGIG